MSVLLPLLVLGGAALLSWPMGRFLVWAVAEPRGPVRDIRALLDRALHRLLGEAAAREQDWRAYAAALLTFNAVTFAFAFLILWAQRWLPLNPDGKGALPLDLIFHTAASFVTNTDLQHYAGEQALSYASQLFAIVWLQFVSAATGLAALAALTRALAGRPSVGNCYRDVARLTSLVLIPLSAALGVFLIVSGVPMTLHGAALAHTLEGGLQRIARGPVAALLAIKQLGTNGGGYFGPNATHPLENPTFWTNAIENVAVVLLPMGCVWMFGRIARRLRDAAVIFGTMGVLLAGSTALAVHWESAPAPSLRGLPIERTGNLEGKELRFGAAAGATWAAATTAAANGSVDAMHDSLNPLTGLVPMAGMWLNTIFGGVGVGMINMFVFALVAVFLAGMMVGRTPEYLSRKIEPREMKLVILVVLLHPLLILGGTALFAATPWGRHAVLNGGSHGFSEILYEFSSAAANNGSGFEGLRDNTIPWNVATGVVIIAARYLPIVLPLAVAASLGAKRPVPQTVGTFRTDDWLFGVVLLGTVLIVGGLLFLPLGVLGPIADHLAALGG